MIDSNELDILTSKLKNIGTEIDRTIRLLLYTNVGELILDGNKKYKNIYENNSSKLDTIKTALNNFEDNYFDELYDNKELSIKLSNTTKISDNIKIKLYILEKIANISDIEFDLDEKEIKYLTKLFN